jgi:CheY-like chemotaxis protein
VPLHGSTALGEVEHGAPPGHGSLQRSVRVLVVEDNPVNQKVAGRMLANLGCRVDMAANGREALDLLSRLPYDVVFMDCMMPEMDGYDATTAIRKIPGPRSKTPIVAMTANAMQGDRERCLTAGMDDYISKPVRAEQLQGAIARWANRVVAPMVRDAALARPVMVNRTPVDLATLDQLAGLQQGGGADIIVELIEIFLADLAPRRAAIRAAVAAGIGGGISSAAHALKGSSAYMGARELHRFCQELEIAGRANDLNAASTILAALEQEADAVHQFLQARLTSPPNGTLR